MNRQLNIVRGLNFMYFAINSMLLALLPLYFSMKGYDSQEIGLFMMAGPFAAIFVQPVWGYLSDRYRSLKIIVFLLFILTVAASVGLFSFEGYNPVLLFSTLMFFFYIPASPLLDSLAIKTVAGTGASYGSVRVFGSVGFCTFAIVTATLLPLVGGVGSFRYIFWALWIVPILLLIFLRDAAGEGPTITLSSIREIGKNKEFLLFLGMVFIICVPHRMNDALFGLYLQSRGATPGMVSFGWALAGMCEIPVFIFLSRHLNRYHELAVLGIVSLLYVLRWILYILVKDPTAIMFLQMTHIFTFAPFWLVAIRYIMRIVPGHLISTGQSLYASVFAGLAGLVGGSVGGWFQDRWGGPGMYGFAAVVSAVAAVSFFTARFYDRRREA
jgi:PPP family 3-phenylpropionic acid transporter